MNNSKKKKIKGTEFPWRSGCSRAEMKKHEMRLENLLVPERLKVCSKGTEASLKELPTTKTILSNKISNGSIGL